MQEFCLRQQIAGAKQFSETYRSFTGDKKRLEPALEECLRSWSKRDVVDWSMASFCARQQADALTRLSH
jgi:hypothetical protein